MIILFIGHCLVYKLASVSVVRIAIIISSKKKASHLYVVLFCFSIIGLYVSFVFVSGKLLRSFFINTSQTIMFDEFPDVDKIMQLCLNIYMARENKEFRLEEELFAKLLFLYRSPELMIMFTKHKCLTKVKISSK